MSLPTTLVYRGVDVKVTERGELVVGALGYSSPYYVRTLNDNTPYNVVTAKSGHVFVITGILIATSKAVVGTATIVLYEALQNNDTAVDNDILTLDMIKEDRVYLNLFNVATGQAKYINIKSSDSEVDCTVFGYYAEG